MAALPPTMKAAVYSEYGEAEGKVFKANAVPQNVAVIIVRISFYKFISLLLSSLKP